MYTNHLYSYNGKTVGEGVKFERIRRVTGYLVGSLDRFNDGKLAEVSERVKHMSFNKSNKQSNEREDI